MRKLSLILAASALIAFAVSAIQPASAQQCPKGQTWDYGTYSCK